MSDLVVWRHEEHHAFEQHAKVEQLVTLGGASFHLEQREEKKKKITVASWQENGQGLLEKTVCDDKQDQKQSNE